MFYFICIAFFRKSIFNGTAIINFVFKYTAYVFDIFNTKLKILNMFYTSKTSYSSALITSQISCILGDVFTIFRGTYEKWRIYYIKIFRRTWITSSNYFNLSFTSFSDLHLIRLSSVIVAKKYDYKKTFIYSDSDLGSILYSTRVS